MHDLTGTMFRAAELDEIGRSLWEPALPLLERAVTGGDEEPFLGAVEAVARGAGISQSMPVAALLDAYSRFSRALTVSLRAHDDRLARRAARRMQAVERVALTRIAAGYVAGLEETIAGLRAHAAESSPVDDYTGAIKPVELLERLDLEVNRCQRMNLSLGLLELEPQAAVAPDVAGHGRAGASHDVGECLRGNLRRYDSIGLTRQGGFLLVLPDISRRGLAGAAERLRREIDGCVPSPGAGEYLFALAHYDLVDTDPAEMLSSLETGVTQARAVREPLTWC